MKKLLFALLLVPCLCFSSHTMLDEAKQAYIEGKYQEAYERYSRYDFYCYRPELEDHFNCFIGRTACQYHLGHEKAFQYNWSLISDLVISEFDEETTGKIVKALRESVYSLIHDDLINKKK